MENKEKMESWKIVLLSVLCTLSAVVMVVFIYIFISTGLVEVIKEEIESDYCSSIPLTEVRDLEVCNGL